MDDVPWSEVVGILVCLGFSGFFSAAETALTALGETNAQKLIDEGVHKARKLNLWLNRPLQVLTTILIWNNLANITASALATDLANHYFADSGIAIAVGVMTFLILTFGEITPKSLAKGNYTRLSIPFIRLLVLPYYLTWPISRVFARATRVFIVWSGGDPAPNAAVTEEDLKYMVKLSTRDGGFDRKKERLLQTVFSYSDRPIKEVMVPRTEIRAIRHDISFEELVEVVQEWGHTRLPVYEDSLDNIIGVFHAKDLFQYLTNRDRSEFMLATYIRPKYFVPDTKPLAELLAEFQRNRTHMALVVDEFGGTDGVVTLEDIIEEFFGEIQDEHDERERPLIEEVGTDYLIASGRASIADVSRELRVEFPEDHSYESIAGFVNMQLGKVPEPDTEFTWNGLRIIVIDSDERRVIRVRIEKYEGEPITNSRTG